ncbi:MAG: LemA family protein [Clostridia bacterium]|jgi:LemA protein
MKFKENRSLAWILVVIAIIASVLISGHVSLSSTRRKVMNTFYETMDTDLSTKSAYADNLSGVASRYLDRNSEYITNMTKARDMLLNAKTPNEKYAASVKITDAAAALYDVLGTKELNETDERLRRSNYADIVAVDDILKRTTFNQDVENFNNELNMFPANVIASITGIDEAEYFR